MNDLNVMLVQCDLVWENPAQNRRNIEELLDHADQQADLIVLPEMFTTAFTMVPHQVAEKYSHDMETLNQFEESHSTQLKKAISQKFLEIRLLSHGHQFYKEVIQRQNVGRRQHLTKTVIFQHL